MKFSKILTYSGCYAIPLISYFFHHIILQFWIGNSILQLFFEQIASYNLVKYQHTGYYLLIYPNTKLPKTWTKRADATVCAQREQRKKEVYKDIVDKLCSSVTSATAATRVDVTSSENIVFFLRWMDEWAQQVVLTLLLLTRGQRQKGSVAKWQREPPVNSWVKASGRTWRPLGPSWENTFFWTSFMTFFFVRGLF